MTRVARWILGCSQLGSDLRFGPIGPQAVHLCVDMQTLFAERTDWHVPWLERVLPVVAHLAEARRERTIFTRFVPPERPEDAWAPGGVITHTGAT
jgi:nicotinamidase-related amidase